MSSFKAGGARAGGVGTKRARSGEWLTSKRSRGAAASAMESSEEGSMDDADLSQISTQQVGAADQKMDTSNLQKEADVGIIERIQLTDFMCHRKLDVTLSPNVNFILGSNGSGKSAIMTAVVVALGGKATTTHRGSSLKNFIRTGSKSAEIIITLRNRGIESYKPAEYGDSITVHRILRDDGTTAYKIKAASGAVISHKKEDLVNILDHWNIQIDNPVSLLDQDTSRHFLHSNNPGHKYKLFVKATRLEQIHRDYEQAQEDQEMMHKSIKRNELLSADLKMEAKGLEERIQLYDRLKEMEEKIHRLELELQWVMVMELERAVLPVEEQLQKEKSRIPRNRQNITKAESKISELDGLLESVGRDLEGIVREAQEIKTRRGKKAQEKKDMEREVREVKLKQRRLRGSIEEQSREKVALQQKMEDLVKMSQEDSEGERARRQREIEESEDDLRRLREELNDIMTRKRNLEDAMKHHEDDVRKIESQRGQVNREMREGENKVNTLQSSRTDQLLAYGSWMPLLVKAVQAARAQFRKPPKGPIGSTFKLYDYRWSVAIEAIIGKDLSAFVVDNPYDKATLQNIISSVLKSQRGPDILTSRYTGRAYDVSNKKPRTDHPTVLDMMEITDLEVRNVLIDQCQVDTVLLIEKRLDAEQVIEVERPRGASVAHTIEGDQILTGRFYANKKRPLGIIRESVNKAIQEEQGRLRDLETRLYKLDMSMKEVRKEAEGSKGKAMSIRRSVTSTQNRIHQVEMRLKELHSADEEEESQEDIATYEHEIQECEARITEMMNQKKEQDAQLSGLKTELDAASLSSVEAEADQVTARMEEIRAQHSEYEHERQKADSVVQHYRERVAEIQAIVSTLENRVSQERKRAEQAAEEASKVCERIETRRSRKSIETEISKLKRRVQQEEPQASEKDAVEQEYVSKIELFKKTMDTIRAHKTALMALRQGLLLRMGQYGTFQDTITARACVYFKHFLQMRDYDGDLRFNHDKETLSMEVRVDRHSKLSQATKNTKALSGGERSFTTVCFIMSLWEAIEAPFRCLDEFDVFMDMMNRRISMKLMMDCALDQKGKQFIFLTPQDMSQMGVPMGPHIKVLKLRPPDRGQTTLD